MRFLFAFLFCLAFVMVVPTQTSAGPPGPETTINYTIDQSFDVPAISFIPAGECIQNYTYEPFHAGKSNFFGTVRIQDKTVLHGIQANIITPIYNIESNYGEVVYAYSMARIHASISYYTIY
jgi:hypothetical protein